MATQSIADWRLFFHHSCLSSPHPSSVCKSHWFLVITWLDLETSFLIVQFSREGWNYDFFGMFSNDLKIIKENSWKLLFIDGHHFLNQLNLLHWLDIISGNYFKSDVSGSNCNNCWCWWCWNMHTKHILKKHKFEPKQSVTFIWSHISSIGPLESFSNCLFMNF